MVTGTKKTERHGLEASVLSGSPTGTSKSGCEPAVGPEEHFGIVASELVAPRGDSGDGTNLLVGFSGWPDSVLRCDRSSTSVERLLRPTTWRRHRAGSADYESTWGVEAIVGASLTRLQ